jgi:hypothetical protein
MSKELKIFEQLVREGNYDNTYKMAWARSLVELSSCLDLSFSRIEIKLDDIAKCYIKYYWNQTIFFNLIQCSNPIKKPTILQIVEELITSYFKYVKNQRPELFERI